MAALAFWISLDLAWLVLASDILFDDGSFCGGGSVDEDCVRWAREVGAEKRAGHVLG